MTRAEAANPDYRLTYARKSREVRALMQVTFRNASAVIANSQNTAEALSAFDIAPDRIQITYPGVDACRFRPGVPGAPALRRRLAPRDELIFLTVARLQRRKGHDLVLRALARMEPGLAFRYAIVGTGDEETRLRQLATELGLSDRVAPIGEVGADELPAYYAAADVFVHPNRTDGDDFEGFGIVFLEAAAAGLPVIGGLSGGAPEAGDDGVTGLLVAGHDADELRTAMSHLAQSPETRRAMGAAGRQRVLRQFSWDRAAAAVAALHCRVAPVSYAATHLG